MNKLPLIFRRLIATGALVALALATLPAGATAYTQSTQPGCTTFPETNKQVCGKFLQYWRDHGALPIQGFPISNEFSEVSSTDGKTYTVQYFERAVFELHPENKAPFDVLLSLLGSQFYKQKYPNGAPGQVANKSTGSLFFPETSANLGGAFLDYWQRTGGLMQHGYPISQEFMEKSDLNGKEYKVQYFERAVFEFHPENPRASVVLLSQLGTYTFNRKYPGGPPQPGTTPLAQGEWGGRSIGLFVTADASRFELDCAHGDIKGQILLDPAGKFSTQGTYTFERGGPIFENDPADTHPALYAGTVTGPKMELTITVNKPEGPQIIGPFVLEQNKQPMLMKCQ
jgi:hypothetical protein